SQPADGLEDPVPVHLPDQLGPVHTAPTSLPCRTYVKCFNKVAGKKRLVSSRSALILPDAGVFCKGI
ncbi:MAG: hypothetical protein DIU70_010945, partial [Bacillota bacterium]